MAKEEKEQGVSGEDFELDFSVWVFATGTGSSANVFNKFSGVESKQQSKLTERGREEREGKETGEETEDGTEKGEEKKRQKKQRKREEKK